VDTQPKAWSPLDREFMRRALALAELGRGATSPNPLVGAVLAQGGKVIAEGFHARLGEPHAEAIALERAGGQASGATLYVNLEPCAHEGRTPPCVEAILRSGVRRVVASMIDPNPRVSGAGFAALRKGGLEVEVGCLESEARRLNESFVVFHEAGRPLVTLKWAMTLDGRIAADAGNSRWISNELSRRRAHDLRAAHDAVLVGAGTVRADDPELSVRRPGYTGRQPLRIVLAGSQPLPANARIFQTEGAGPTLIAAGPAFHEASLTPALNAGVRLVRISAGPHGVELEPMMKVLHQEGILSVLVEGGARVFTSFLRADLADKVIVFLAPKLIGGAQFRSPTHDLARDTISQALTLTEVSLHAFEGDVCFEGYLRSI